MNKDKETIAIGWCDNGNADGKFTEGLMFTVINGQKENNIKIDAAIRVQGNQIGRQRQILFDLWADTEKTDWLLWVDSDIIIDQEILKKLFDVANKKTHPVVAGVYFVSIENEKSLMQPVPCIFYEGKDEFDLVPVLPFIKNQTIKIDFAGMGLVLMHKSIIPKLRQISPNYSLFAEQQNLKHKHIGEDVVFFKNLKKAGVPVYANTGALVQHFKRFSLDENYFNVYWNAVKSGNIIFNEQ
jgi:hypothetical protein